MFVDSHTASYIGKCCDVMFTYNVSVWLTAESSGFVVWSTASHVQYVFLGGSIR